MEATAVEIQPGKIEGETLTAPVRMIVQHPLPKTEQQSTKIAQFRYNSAFLPPSLAKLVYCPVID